MYSQFCTSLYESRKWHPLKSMQLSDFRRPMYNNTISAYRYYSKKKFYRLCMSNGFILALNKRKDLTDKYF